MIPFFERGVPVEYELVRSIATITQQKRKRVGVLQTDARSVRRASISAGGRPRQRPKEPLITNWKSNTTWCASIPTNPITERYDVLLAVQPSSLGPQQLTNFIDAVKRGSQRRFSKIPCRLMRAWPARGNPSSRPVRFSQRHPKAISTSFGTCWE